ncbi:MAG: hypothetical protein PHQ28_00080 [Mycobacterium sp.]|nr:hypothetical protein [Mycobacterium sp.]
MLQTSELPLGTVLRALLARGVSRAVADNTIDALVHGGRIVLTDTRRLALVPAGAQRAVRQ